MHSVRPIRSLKFLHRDGYQSKTVFSRFLLKIGFDAKMGEWVGQDLSVHMTLSVGRNNTCWTLSSTLIEWDDLMCESVRDARDVWMSDQNWYPFKLARNDNYTDEFCLEFLSMRVKVVIIFLNRYRLSCSEFSHWWLESSNAVVVSNILFKGRLLSLLS